MRVGFIGGGVMGESLIKSLLARGVSSPNDIVVSDISQGRRDFLSREYSIKITASNIEAADNAEIIILAIKPQDLNTALSGLKDLSPQQLVLSIVAGAPLKTIQQQLGHSCLIRSMPNMPAQIGEGVTVWTATAEVNDHQKGLAKSVLTALGEEIYVDNEKYIDMATALSGSGPAYIFLIIEALIDAGVHIGLSRDIAEKLVIETTIGSARTAKVMGKHPAALRNMVTSPGGTTTEGLLQLELGGLRSHLLRAVSAAYDKSKSLGSK